MLWKPATCGLKKVDADHISSSGSTLTMAEHNKLNESQVRRAAAALLKHVNSAKAGKSNLLEDEGEVVLAQVSLHKIPGKVTAKPIPIAIPHPLRRSEDCDMCLFVKDNAKSWIKEMVEAEPVEGLTKIIKLQKLRTEYHEFKDRRQLLSQYDLFLADDRILPMLTKALGKTFLKVKKQPVPIKLERRSSLAAQIARARDSAFMCGSYGDCWAIKLAHTAMTENEVVENLMAGIAAAVDKMPKKWKNVKAINIKCSNSVALPVYSSVGDIPPAPPARVAEIPQKGETRPGKGGKDTARKTRKIRPLIRQQLNKVKEEVKAEKAAATAAPTGVKTKNRKRGPSENIEPGAGEAIAERKVKEGRKTLTPATDAGEAAGDRVKTRKRRKSAVA